MFPEGIMLKQFYIVQYDNYNHKSRSLLKLFVKTLSVKSNIS